MQDFLLQPGKGGGEVRSLRSDVTGSTLTKDEWKLEERVAIAWGGLG